MPLTPSQAELLRKIVLGELDPQDAAVREEAQANPAFAGELRQSLDLLKDLDSFGTIQQTNLNAARELASAPGEDRVVAYVRAQTQAAQPQPRRPLRRWLLFTAAALLAIVLMPLAKRRAAQGPADPYLGTEQPTLEANATLGDDGTIQFQWRSSRPGGYVAIVLTEPAPGTWTLRSRELEGVSEWLFPAHPWPKTLEWDIYWYPARGETPVLASGTLSP